MDTHTLHTDLSGLALLLHLLLFPSSRSLRLTTGQHDDPYLSPCTRRSGSYDCSRSSVQLDGSLQPEERNTSPPSYAQSSSHWDNHLGVSGYNECKCRCYCYFGIHNGRQHLDNSVFRGYCGGIDSIVCGR